jgi:integrase
MATKINRLTARMVSTLSEPGRHSDGANLYLEIKKTGARSWVFMYRLGGKQRELGLGSAGPGGVTLAQAREKAAEARRQLQDGIDPLAGRKAAEAARKAATTTFGQFADAYVADHRSGWSNPKHAAQWKMTLGDAYCSKIRQLPIAEIEIEEIVSVLKPVWQTRPETARRVRMRLEKVLDAARVLGLRSGENPARWRGNLDHLLPRQTIKKGHHAALPFAEVPAFVEALRQREGGTAALALEFTVLTAIRTSEALEARWEEFDLEKKEWTIPAVRMKAKREFKVPLSRAALDALARAQGRDEVWVFPGQKPGKPLSNMSMLMQLRRMKRDDITVHGFRSTMTDWASECMNFPNELIKMAKAHSIEDKTEAAYRRGDLFEKRRELMEAWARYVMTPPSATASNVVPLRG